MQTRSVHIRVIGRVQGVFFRDYTSRKALELGLKGWVRNCRDGSVEAQISGPPETIAQMIEWFYTGSPHSRVDDVTVNDFSIVELQHNCSRQPPTYSIDGWLWAIRLSY